MTLNLNAVATLVLGIYAGSLLTEGVVLVPYWRRMPHAEFMRLHGDVGPSLFRYFAPLTTAALLLSVVAAVRGPALASGEPWRPSSASAPCSHSLPISRGRTPRSPRDR